MAVAAGARAWPALDYESWPEICDTLHAESQILGKVALALAEPEPELMHSALKLTTRGIETAPLPALDGSGALVLALDLRRHEAVAEHSDGRAQRFSLVGRSVAALTADLVASARELAGGSFHFNPAPQEVPWQTPLDEDEDHADYEPALVEAFHAAATQAALALSSFRAPYRGRATPVNFWWGTFDLAVSLFSGQPMEPPQQDFIWRNAADAEQIEVGWWPGDARYPRAAFYAFAMPAPEGFSALALDVGRWDETLGEYLLDQSEALESGDPYQARQLALRFARSVAGHACDVCNWPQPLAASVRGEVPAVS